MKGKSIKRIHRDLEEIKRFPIEGVGVCCPNDSNPFELRANILILEGKYKDILLHLVMFIPENYPAKAPKMIIAPGQDFNHNFHHHLFEDPKSGGQTICIDLLDHGFFGESEKTGWSPAYTLSTILMQMQVFFSKDYDLPQAPKAAEIENLKKKLRLFTAKIQIGPKEYITHSFEKPFPAVYFRKNEISNKSDFSDIERVKMTISREKLTCYLTRMTFEEEECLLGYPMKLQRDKFGRLHILPILELLSYEGYMLLLMETPYQSSYVKDFDKISLRTASASEFNYWFPIYTNEKSYQKFKQHVWNSFSVFSFGIEGKKEYDFQVDQILTIFPCLMNKMIVHLQKGVLHESIAAIEAYAHFLRLFIRLMGEFPQIQKAIDRKVENAMKSENSRNKKNLGDMGEFLIILSFSSFPFDDTEIWNALLVEFLSRQFYWVIERMAKGEKLFEKQSITTYGESFTNLKQEQYIEFFSATKVSNNILLFNYSASQTFLADKRVFVKKMEDNFGVIEEVDVQNFITQINKVKIQVNSYGELLSYIGLGHLSKSPEFLKKVFKQAWINSEKQKYNKHFF